MSETVRAAGCVVHVRKDPFDVYVGRGRGSVWLIG